MPGYKLRLGDGTFLVVDYNGLSTWLTDDSAMVQVVGSQRWTPLKQFLADERAARLTARAREAAAARETPPPPPPPRPPEDEPPPLTVGEPAGVQVLADEPAVGGPVPGPQTSTPIEDLPVIPLKPLADETELRPAPARTGPLKPVPVIVPPKPPVPASVPLAPPPEAETYRPSDDDQPPAIPRTPLVERAPARAGVDDADALAEVLRDHRLSGTLLRATSRLGRFLSRCLDPINRLERGLSPFPPPEGTAPWDADDSASGAARGPGVSAGAVPEITVLAEEPVQAPDPDARETSDEGLPILGLKPLDDRDPFPRAAAKLRRILGRASARVTDLTQRVGRAARRDRPRPSASPSEPAVSFPARLTSPEPLTPPPSISELPSLRLAPTDEPEEPADLYDEADVYGRVSPVHAVWLWTRRVVLIAGLVTGGVWVALFWETWVPKATELGRIVFTELDSRVQARYQAKRRERALLETVEQVPHLARGTIDLLFSSSPTGILEPPEVFRLACAAADQGVPALTAEEAQELAGLRRELLERLSPAERGLAREYDLVRARRTTFTFEDQGALRLFARGARALPSRSLDRLQALSGKAIAAGLATQGAPRPGVEN